MRSGQISITYNVMDRATEQKLIKKYGKDPISTGGGSWYPQACIFLKLHHTHSYYERSIIERTIQYIKDRTESFDDYFPCQKDNLYTRTC